MIVIVIIEIEFIESRALHWVPGSTDFVISIDRDKRWRALLWSSYMCGSPSMD